MKNVFKYLLLGGVGGVIYAIIECLFRGYTHFSMILLGGVCFVLIGLINEQMKWETPLILQMLIAAVVVTALELVAGIILNIILGLEVWDYSNQWGNFLGQVCPLFFVAWYFLSLPAILLDDYLRYWILKEEKPHYKLF